MAENNLESSFQNEKLSALRHAGLASAEYKIWAERWLGRELARMPKQHGARPTDTGSHDATPLGLEELGVHLTLGATGNTSDS